MKKTWLLILSGLLGLSLLTACNSAGGTALPTPLPSASPQPSVEKTLPTPVAPGQAAVYGDLQVVMMQAEITTSYLNEYGSTREPPAGMKFLWIHIGLMNTGQEIQDLPASEHFIVLNDTTEFKSIYGYRQEYVDYMALTTGLVQGQELEAWLRYDIPAALELTDLKFAFLPETTQISVGFSSSDYPVGDHPIYLWTCAP